MTGNIMTLSKVNNGINLLGKKKLPSTVKGLPKYGSGNFNKQLGNVDSNLDNSDFTGMTMQGGSYLSTIGQDDEGRKTNAGAALSSGLSGAGIGATIGSAFSPVGTAIGAGVGLLAGSIIGGVSNNQKNKKIDAEIAKEEEEKQKFWDAVKRNQDINQLATYGTKGELGMYYGACGGKVPKYAMGDNLGDPPREYYTRPTYPTKLAASNLINAGYTDVVVDGDTVALSNYVQPVAKQTKAGNKTATKPKPKANDTINRGVAPSMPPTNEIVIKPQAPSMPANPALELWKENGIIDNTVQRVATGLNYPINIMGAALDYGLDVVNPIGYDKNGKIQFLDPIPPISDLTTAIDKAQYVDLKSNASDELQRFKENLMLSTGRGGSVINPSKRTFTNPITKSLDDVANTTVKRKLPSTVVTKPVNNTLKEAANSAKSIEQTIFKGKYSSPVNKKITKTINNGDKYIYDDLVQQAEMDKLALNEKTRQQTIVKNQLAQYEADLKKNQLLLNEEKSNLNLEMSDKLTKANQQAKVNKPILDAIDNPLKKTVKNATKVGTKKAKADVVLDTEKVAPKPRRGRPKKNDTEIFAYGGMLPKYACGGKTKKRKYALGGTLNTPNGSAIPLSEDTSLLQGNSHEQGGIQLNRGNTPIGEVEGDEVIARDKNGDNEFIFSRRLGFAPVAEKLIASPMYKQYESTKAVIDEGLANPKINHFAKNTLIRKRETLINPLEILYNKQEQFKQANGITNPNGTAAGGNTTKELMDGDPDTVTYGGVTIPSTLDYNTTDYAKGLPDKFYNELHTDIDSFLTEGGYTIDPKTGITNYQLPDGNYFNKDRRFGLEYAAMVNAMVKKKAANTRVPTGETMQRMSSIGMDGNRQITSTTGLNNTRIPTGESMEEMTTIPAIKGVPYPEREGGIIERNGSETGGTEGQYKNYFNMDKLSNGLAESAPYISSMYNASQISNTSRPKVPRPYVYTPLDSSQNVTVPLLENREAAGRANTMLSRSGADPTVVRAAMAGNLDATMRSSNTLYADSRAKRKAIDNMNISGMDKITNLNIDKMQNYDDLMFARRENIRGQQMANVANTANVAQLRRAEKNQENLQRDQMYLDSQKYAGMDLDSYAWNSTLGGKQMNDPKVQTAYTQAKSSKNPNDKKLFNSLIKRNGWNLTPILV